MKKYIETYYGGCPEAWQLAWAHPTDYGHVLDPPFATFPTRSAAILERRRVYNEMSMYPLPERPATSESKLRYAERKRRKQRNAAVAAIALVFLRKGKTLAQALAAARRQIYG